MLLGNKLKKDSFVQLVHDKFLIINVMAYKRIMFLDADLIPLTGLDYFFHLSDPEYTTLSTLLKPFFHSVKRRVAQYWHVLGGIFKRGIRGIQCKC